MKVIRTIHYFLSSKALMNCVTILFFATAPASLVCAAVRGLRIYKGEVIKISILIAVIFIVLFLYRSQFWKFFRKLY